MNHLVYVCQQQHGTKSRAVETVCKDKVPHLQIDYKRDIEALAELEDRSATFQEDTIIKFLG